MSLELFPTLPSRVVSIGQLDADMTSGDASAVLAVAVATTLRGTGQFRVMVDDEIMIAAGASSSTTVPIAARGAEGTTAAAHTRGAHVYFVLTAGALANLVDPLRSSDVYTMPRALAQASVTLTSGTVYGRRAIILSPGTYTKVRFATGPAGAGVTELKVGAADSGGRPIAETADLSGSFAQGTLFDNVALSASVTVTLTTIIYGVIGSVASTAISVRGLNASAAVDGVSPALSKNVTGFTDGAALPTLTGGAVGIVPWIEFIP